MPTEARVQSYDPARGFGTLITRTGEVFAFELEKFRGKGPVAAAIGKAVRVEWKRARAGAWNVPASVIEVGWAPAPPPPHFTLEQWLTGFNARCQKLGGLTAGMLRRTWPFEEYEEGGGGGWSRGKRGDANDAVWILHAVHSLATESEAEDKWAIHRTWVRVFDWKDHDSLYATAEMLGLDAQPAGEPDEWLARCNHLAAAKGNADRLASVGNDDNVVIVALTLEQQRALTADGYLVIR
jgi:hypothetical protein